MSRVLVEHPVEEAEAMLKRLGIEPLTGAESLAAARGVERLKKAVAVERGASGNAERPPTAEEVEALVGQDVRVSSEVYGNCNGLLRDLTEPKVLLVEAGELRLTRRIPLGAVISIQPAEDLAEAA
jgi:hypothetical protein